MENNEEKREEYQARLSDLQDRRNELNAFAEEKHGRDTRAAYREENGEEMDEFDESNLNDQAAIDASDEDDAGLAEEIGDDLDKLGRRIEAIDSNTTADVIDGINAALGNVATKLAERGRNLGHRD